MASPCSGVWAPTALSYFTATTSGMLSVIGTCGNLLIFLAVIKDPHKKLRTPFMYFLINLAFSDLVVGCVTLPTSVITHTMEAHGTKKKVHVTIIQVSYFMSSTASLLSLAALCIDRYFAVRHPMTYRRHIRWPLCLLASLVIWAISLGLPFLFFLVGYMNYLMIFAHTAIGVTLAIIAFTYLNIYRIIRDQAWKMRAYRHSRHASVDCSIDVDNGYTAQEKNITKTFLLILCFVLVCYTPAVICIYVLKFCPTCDCKLRHVLRDFQFLFIVANSCVNPFLCTIRLRPFRNALYHIFGLTRLRVPTDSGDTSTQKKTDSSAE